MADLDEIAYMTDEQIEKTWGKGNAPAIRKRLEQMKASSQAEFMAESQPPPRRKNRRGDDVPLPPDEVIQDFSPAPFNRSVGGTRGKYESPAEFEFRMNQGIPRGARHGGGGGLGQFYLMNEGGMSAEDARLKSNIISSRGGQIVRNEDGKLVQQSIGARRAPQSSTGRAYDPVAERKNLMADAKAAVAGKVQNQAADQVMLEKFQESTRIPDTTRGFANQYGFGQAKTLSEEEFANRPAGTVTEGRNFPVTNKITEVVDWMKKGQGRK
jgi:hypothetical protein